MRHLVFAGVTSEETSFDRVRPSTREERLQTVCQALAKLRLPRASHVLEGV
jgi:hypothetical protein